MLQNLSHKLSVNESNDRRYSPWTEFVDSLQPVNKAKCNVCNWLDTAVIAALIHWLKYTETTSLTCWEKCRSSCSRCRPPGPGSAAARSHQAAAANSTQVCCGTAAGQVTTLPAEHPSAWCSDPGLTTALQMLQYKYTISFSAFISLATEQRRRFKVLDR